MGRTPKKHGLAVRDVVSVSDICPTYTYYGRAMPQGKASQANATSIIFPLLGKGIVSNN